MNWLIVDSKWKEQKLKSGRERNLKTIKKIKKLVDDTKQGQIPVSHLRTVFKKVKDLAETL
jgi:hypothetical protein